MATRIYGLDPGGSTVDVVEAIGPTATSAIVAVVVDLATNVTGQAGDTRAPSRDEVLLALDNLRAYIYRDNSWPPA